MSKATILAALIPAMFVAGCASDLGSADYSRAETRRIQDVHMGVVESVRPVTIQGTRSGVGATTGAVVGGIAGSEVGQGKGAAVSAVLGAVVGGLAGQAIEQNSTRKPGLEITLRLDSGRTIAIVQQDDGEHFAPGDRVRMLESGGEARVTH